MVLVLVLFFRGYFFYVLDVEVVGSVDLEVFWIVIFYFCVKIIYWNKVVLLINGIFFGSFKLGVKF